LAEVILKLRICDRELQFFIMKYNVKDGSDLSQFLTKKVRPSNFEAELVKNLNSPLFPLEWIKVPKILRNRNDFSEWRNEVGFKGTLEALLQCACTV